MVSKAFELPSISREHLVLEEDESSREKYDFEVELPNNPSENTTQNQR